MNVLFVHSVDETRADGSPLLRWQGMQFGVSYISSTLKADGHETCLLVLVNGDAKRNRQRVAAQINASRPELICFTSVFSQYGTIREAANFIKITWPDIFLLIGGVHATLQPDEVIADAFDAVCIGEGEYPTRELCRQLQCRALPHGIANLWFKQRGGAIEKNRPREFIRDLDRLPFPDRALWEPWLSDHNNHEIVVLAGRGCPYGCSYCCNAALRKVAPGRYVRNRSPENILAEITFLYERYPQRFFSFEIETLDCCRTWALELCGMLEEFNAARPAPAAFAANYRVNPRTIDEELFVALGRANFTTLNIGLESGSERLRRDVLKRHYTNDDFFTVVSLARRHGMKIFLYNMIGLPGETREDHQETVRLNRQVQPDGHYTGIFYPYPGTELHAYCLNHGLLEKTTGENMERRRPAIRLPHFSGSEIARAHAWFDYHVYKGHQPTLSIIRRVLSIKLQANPRLNSLYQKLSCLLP